MSRIGLVARGVVSEYLLWGATILSGLLLTPILLRYLHPEGYGLWAIFGSILGYLGLMDLGLGLTTTTQVAHLQTLRRNQAIGEFVSTALFLYLPLSVVGLIGILAFAPIVPSVFRVSSGLQGVAPWAFAVAGMGAALALPRGLLRGIIVGYQRIALANLLDTAFILTAIGAVAIAVVSGTGLLGTAVAGTVITGLHTLASSVVVRRSFPTLKLVPRVPTPRLAADTVRFGVPIAVVSIAGQIVFRTDNVVIGLFKGAETVASYAVAYALTWFALILVFKVSDSLLPMFSSLRAAGEEETLRQAYLESSRLSVALGMCLTVGLIVFGKRAIGIWVGPQHFVGMPTFLILALLPTINASTHVGSILLIGLGRARSVASANIYEALVNLTLSVLLIRWIGVAGVALGTVVGELLTTFWYVPRLSNHELGVSGRRFVVGVWLRPLIPLLPATAAAFAADSALRMAPPLHILLAGAVTTVGVYFGLYFVLSTERERTMYSRAMRALWARTRATPVEG